jgi:tetratricopeptide (TPR) repeat protein
VSVLDRTALEDERQYLLDSIEQLDREHADGTLADDEYQALHDQQVARAAEVLRALEQPDAGTAAPSPSATSLRSAWRRATARVQRKHAVWIAGVVAFVIVAIVGVAITATGRQAGQTTTGSIAEDSNTLIRQAQDQLSNGKALDAVKTYDKVLQRDPQNVQALSYRGWLVRLAGLPNEGLQSIDKAIAIQPKYPDAHFFRGFIYLRDRNDPNTAINEFNQFLADNPPQDMVPLVQQALQDAQAKAAAASTPTTAAPKK